MGIEVAYIERWGVCRDPWLCDATLQPLSGSSVVFPRHVSTGVPCEFCLSGSIIQGGVMGRGDGVGSGQPLTT